MAHEIIAAKGMGCSLAKKVEIANDDSCVESSFWKMIGGRPSTQETQSVPGLFEPFSTDRIYSVTDDGELEEISEGEPPRMELLDSTRVLLFDFGVELYVWVGREADRAHIEMAVERTKDLTVSLSFTMIFRLTLPLDLHPLSAQPPLLRRPSGLPLPRQVPRLA